MSLDTTNNIAFAYANIDEAFPPCDAQFTPTGNRVLVQLRTPKKRTKFGIIIPDEVRDTENWNTQVGKVLSVGSLAFKDRNTLQPWPEGAWFEIGDYIRAPKYGGDRWTVKALTKDEHGDDQEVLLALFKETEIGGVFTGDPTTVKAFL